MKFKLMEKLGRRRVITDNLASESYPIRYYLFLKERNKCLVPI